MVLGGGVYSSEVGTGLLLRGNNRGGGGVCTVQRLEQDCCVEATKRGGGVCLVPRME